jgi:hypothetical protein
MSELSITTTCGPTEMFVKNPYYEVRATPHKGYGCFAIQDLKRGTRILTDCPLVIVPIAKYFISDIEEAARKLSPKERELYFSLASGHGQDPRKWPSKVHTSVVSVSLNFNIAVSMVSSFGKSHNTVTNHVSPLSARP